jgi:signal transduction histidine kinase/DNA-binding response OmpR family regulator
VLALALSVSALRAASAEWRHWQSNQGLVDSYIESISRTPDGVYWAVHADVAGISRFDGRDWVRIPAGFLRNQFDSLDGRNGWVFLNKTLYHLQDQNWQSFDIGSETGGRGRFLRVLDLGDSKAMVFFAKGVLRFSLRSPWQGGMRPPADRPASGNGQHGESVLPESWSLEALPLPVSRLGDWTVVERAVDGTVWLLGAAGVAGFTYGPGANPPYQWSEYPVGSLGVANLVSLIPGLEGEVFATGQERAGDRRVGLRLRKGRWEVVTRQAQARRPLRLWRDGNGYFWMADGNALFRRPVASPAVDWERIEQEDEVLAGSLRGVIVNPDGTFVLATTRGLVLHVKAAWESIGRTADSAGKPLDLRYSMTSVVKDSRQRVWFLGDHTLVKLDSGSWDEYQLPTDFVPDGNQSNIGVLGDGRIVMQLHMPPALGVFDPATLRFSRLPAPEGYGPILFAPRSVGGFWVALRAVGSGPDALGILSGDAISSVISIRTKWNINNAKTMAEGPNGEVWVGGSGGARRFANNRCETIDFSGTSGKGAAGPAVGLGGVFAFMPERDGSVLIGARQVIARWQGGRVTPVTTRIQIPRRFIRDGSGVIWVASASGVYRTVQRVRGAPASVTDDWIFNSTLDGLPSVLAQGIVEDGQGNIWAATNNGPAVYRFGTDGDAPRAIIPPDQNTTEFVQRREARILFSGKDRWDVTPPELLEFSYRIDGGAWSPFRPGGMATLSGFGSGGHRFELQAMDRQGNISPQPARFRFWVVAPWYLAPAFLAFAVGAAGVIGYLIWLSQRHYRERGRLIKELSAACRLANSASRVKSDFLANMSHEIRTPMNGVIGMTELALQADPNPEQKEYLEMARSSGYALLSVINDILDFSKIEADRLELCRDAFRLDEALREALRTVALRAHESGLDVVYEIGGDVPNDLVGDAGRLRQIVLNLVGNAVKFTSLGEVELGVRLAQPAGEGVRLHFSVRDTGIGIPAEKHRLIFEAFSQADGSTTRSYGGTGLGLSISRRLVEMMGGEIWLESELGKGSTFHFTAAFGRAEAGSGLFAPVAERLCVLAVDDNAAVRRALRSALESCGAEVTLAQDGPEALRMLDDRSFDLVLLDMTLPGMSGAEVLRRIAEIPRHSGIKIVPLMSPGAAEIARPQGLCYALLYKPVGRADLAALLRSASVGGPYDAALPEAVPAAVAARGVRVLVAEDNAVNQKLVCRILEKAGYDVAIVGDGRQALETWEKGEFDVVLMDVQMPVMDGYASCAAIRQCESERRRGHARTPIIALTAHATDGDRERCLKAGMDGFASKPLRTQDLIALIEGVTGGGVGRSACQPASMALGS